MKELIRVDGNGAFQVALGYELPPCRAFIQDIGAFMQDIVLPYWCLLSLLAESQSDILIDVGSSQKPQSIVLIVHHTLRKKCYNDMDLPHPLSF